MKLTVLVVDDEPALAETLAMILTRAGYDASAVFSGEAALEFLKNNRAALVVSDVMMPGISGLDVAIQIRQLYPDCGVLLFSGNADTQSLLESAQHEGHAFEVLAKPISPQYLLERIAMLAGA
jgi:CheY-like chemotaxis protein